VTGVYALGFKLILQIFFTLAVFSFLYRDSPIYRFAEHVFVGVATGYAVVVQFHTVFMPNLVRPLRDEMELEFTSGTLGVMHTPGHTPGHQVVFVKLKNTGTIDHEMIVLKTDTPFDQIPITGHVFCADAFLNLQVAWERRVLADGAPYIIAAAGAGRGATFSAMVFEH